MCSAEIVEFPNCCAVVQTDQASDLYRRQAETRSISVRPSSDERAMIRLHFLGPDGQPHQSTISSTFKRRAGNDDESVAANAADSDEFIQMVFERYYAPFGCTFLYANMLNNKMVDLT